MATGSEVYFQLATDRPLCFTIDLTYPCELDKERFMRMSAVLEMRLSWMAKPRIFYLLVYLLSCNPLWSQEVAVQSLTGTLRDASGNPLLGEQVQLQLNGHKIISTTKTEGIFQFEDVPPGHYMLYVVTSGHTIGFPNEIDVPLITSTLTVTLPDRSMILLFRPQDQEARSGGEALSADAVSGLPLNKRDFSQLLLLAAGTMTDVNGASNFTQQFAINGQRGVEAVFAMDGADVSDPELGGATFTNFNVDAVQEIRSSSGWMPADIGRGASGFTNIVTRSGLSGFHGSFFEFVRNSAFDARNFFDYSSVANPGRIPPFRRNEFGFTNGGPVVLPYLYDGREKVYYYGEYQGFRQVLGTTQVLPVPTVEQRAGQDTTAFPNDTLLVPVDPQIASILARYPLPNYPLGAYGPNTYATSSKVTTDADQFSVRLDVAASPKSSLFGRFTLDNLIGPTTNPDQTAINPTFGVEYVDRQRNGVFTYTRTVSPQLSFQSSISFTRTTPSYPTENHTDPAVKFNDGLFESFNAAGGSVSTYFNNLFEAQQNFSIAIGTHVIKLGGEVRLNRDTTYFGASPNGEYDFGGGTAYSPVSIASQSGTHNIQPGDPLPDTLSGFLTGSPFAYTVAVAPSYFSNGTHIGPAAINRNAAAVFAQDTWKVSSRFVLDYGVRYEIYSLISERAKRTGGLIYQQNGDDLTQQYVINPQPAYKLNLNGWGPRIGLNWSATKKLVYHIGGAITIIPPNIGQDNFLTAGTPFVVYPRLTATPNAAIRYGFQITPSQLPEAYTPSGQNIFAQGSKAVPANTVMDINRYEQSIATLTPSHQITPLNIETIDRNFGNGYLQTWTFGLKRILGKGLSADVNYVGTAAVHLARVSFPNAYAGADPAFARYTQFDNLGNVTGGFGTESVITGNSHSTYHALQASLEGTLSHGGPGIQASYSWSKSIDETSSVSGGFIAGASGAIVSAYPQNPFDTHAEKGPSAFDATHSFTASVAQDLHVEGFKLFLPLSRKITQGWELLSISSISSGAPFTVYSGVQQTGVGSNSVDRPDQIAKPQLSTTRSSRVDYFGRGQNNASFFSIPIQVSGGTGPNKGRFGTLGRNTFRGPAYYDYDFSLIKDSPFGKREAGGPLANLQFRSEFFNLFNIVNMGLPANIIRGSGFGVISRTAGTSRQIQFSLKLIY